MPRPRAFIIHGYLSHPGEAWLPWLRVELEKRGYGVALPAMPNPDRPVISEWIAFVAKLVGEPDDGTVMVGHSMGCQAVIRYLETLGSAGKSVAKTVLVAGGFPPGLTAAEADAKTGGSRVLQPWFTTQVDAAKVKKSGGQMHRDPLSDDDPYIDISHATALLPGANLGPKIVLETGKGHYNEDTTVTELPAALGGGYLLGSFRFANLRHRVLFLFCFQPSLRMSTSRHPGHARNGNGSDSRRSVSSSTPPATSSWKIFSHGQPRSPACWRRSTAPSPGRRRQGKAEADRSLARFTLNNGKKSTRLLYILDDDPLFLELVDWPPLMPYVKGLVNPDPHHHASDAIVEYGSDLMARKVGGWHIDGNDNGYRGLGRPIPLLQLKVGYYLTDMTQPGNANLTVVPGSHRSPCSSRHKPRICSAMDLVSRSHPGLRARGQRHPVSQRHLAHRRALRLAAAPPHHALLRV